MIPTRKVRIGAIWIPVFRSDHARLDAYQLSLKTLMLIACSDRYH